MSSPFPHLFQPINIGAKQSRNRVMLRAFDEPNIEIHDNLWVDRAEGGSLVLHHGYNTSREIRIADVGALIWVGVQRANDSLVHELNARGVKELKGVGDAYAPRRLLNAIHEGHRAARAVSAERKAA